MAKNTVDSLGGRNVFMFFLPRHFLSVWSVKHLSICQLWKEGVTSVEEDLLVKRIAEGDQAAFAELYASWSRRIMSYCVRTLRNTEEAEDVVQETFLQLFKAASTYRAEGKFAGFIFRIAGNLVRSRFRGNPAPDSLTRMLDDEEQEMPHNLRYIPEDGILDRIDLEAALGMLPDRQREALLLVGQGLSYREGAEVLGVTVEAFAQLVLRGRRILRGNLVSSVGFIKGVVG